MRRTFAFAGAFEGGSLHCSGLSKSVAPGMVDWLGSGYSLNVVEWGRADKTEDCQPAVFRGEGLLCHVVEGLLSHEIGYGVGVSFFAFSGDELVDLLLPLTEAMSPSANPSCAAVGSVDAFFVS